MTEGVDVPANDRDGIISKLLLEPLVTDKHIIHHVVVVSAGFVMHRPASVHEFETALLDKVAHLIFEFIILMIPPE